MSRLMEWQWADHLAPLLPICTLSILREKPLCLLSIPSGMVQVCGRHMGHSKQAQKQAFLDHISSIDPAIKFTVEGTHGNGAIPFLDTLVTPLADNSLSITVYCKPTHTDQYLQWDSHHSLSARYSVIGTLTHRAKTVCTDPGLLQKELTNLRKALGKCNYPAWAINRIQNKVLNNNWEDHSNNSPLSQNDNNSQVPATHTGDNKSNQTQNNNNQGTNPLPTTPRNKSTVRQVVIPYTKGIEESIKHICGKYGIQVHFKGNTTIKQVLMKPKDQDPNEMKSRVIYSFQCNHIACNEEYIRGNSKDPWRKKQGTPQTTLSHPCAHTADRTQYHRHQLQHHRQGGLGAGQDP